MHPVFATTYTPVNPADVSDAGSHWLTMAGVASLEYYVFSSTAPTSSLRNVPQINADSQFSLVAMTGYGSASAKGYFLNILNQIVTYNLTAGVVEADPFLDGVVEGYSLTVSANASHTTMIGIGSDGSHGSFEVNLQTGVTNKIFSTEGDGAFSTTNFYQSYGADGLLYILDYGNDRVAVLDPDDGYSEKRSFTLTSTVANMQFAMDANGDLFLGDGAGGGSMYSSTGTLLDTFLLPSGTYADPFPSGSHPYVDYTPAGHVFVFDNTGAHQNELVPELATWALLSLGQAWSARGAGETRLPGQRSFLVVKPHFALYGDL